MPSGPPGEHLGDTLSAFLDDELAPAARHESEVHLAACAACRAELEEVAAARRAIRIMPVHVAPRPLVAADGSGAPIEAPGPLWPGFPVLPSASWRHRFGSTS